MGAEAALVGSRERRVLVVDDDARVRQALRALLGSSPGLCVVGERSSGSGALAADEELRPDVVVLDLLLPTAPSGLEALAVLVGRGRPVVALSIRSDMGPAALAAGAAAFFDKGSIPDLLVSTLRDVPLPPPAGP